MLWLALLLIESLIARCSMFAEKKRLLMVVCWVNKWSLAPISASIRAGEEMGPLS